MPSAMNLATPDLISQLLASTQPARRLPVSPAEQLLPATRKLTRACRCGVCAKCSDDARWEEIFAKKFADPEYYSRGTLRHSSPLDSPQR
jgi:hypothetical protein